MTISRNKREGWYQARYQGEIYRTFKKRNSLRYNYKLGSPAWVQDLVTEARNKPAQMRDYILDDSIKYMYPNIIRGIDFTSKGPSE